MNTPPDSSQDIADLVPLSIGADQRLSLVGFLTDAVAPRRWRRMMAPVHPHDDHCRRTPRSFDGKTKTSLIAAIAL